MTVCPGATGAWSCVRAPFQTTVPADVPAVDTWYASANFSDGSQVSDPVFRTATGIVTAAPAAAASVCVSNDDPYGNGLTGATTATWSKVRTPLPLNQVTPSCTRSHRSV